MSHIKKLFHRIGLTRSNLRATLHSALISSSFLKSFIKTKERKMIFRMGDPIRYGTLYLALQDIAQNKILGSLAECGIYKGFTSGFIHKLLPERPFFLFDTFEGFDQRDLSGVTDLRFSDTSVSKVIQQIGDTNNVIIRKGFFPDTTKGIENETFAFVLIDFDKYDPTLAALTFFYERIVPGGYLFVHDYNNPESDWACMRAVQNFFKDKLEKPIGIPDMYGTVVLRKN